MSKLIISAKDLILYLKKLDYFVISQTGSHIKLKNAILNKTIIVPNHNPVAKGTLNNILNILSYQTGKDKEVLKIELFS